MNEPLLTHSKQFRQEGSPFVDLEPRGTLVVLFAEPVESLSFRVVDPVLFNYSFRYTCRNRGGSWVSHCAYEQGTLI